jgi:hypothetical protein
LSGDTREDFPSFEDYKALLEFLLPREPPWTALTAARFRHTFESSREEHLGSYSHKSRSFQRLRQRALAGRTPSGFAKLLKDFKLAAYGHLVGDDIDGTYTNITDVISMVERSFLERLNVNAKSAEGNHLPFGALLGIINGDVSAGRQAFSSFI